MSERKKSQLFAFRYLGEGEILEFYLMINFWSSQKRVKKNDHIIYEKLLRLNNKLLF